jgi:hypothetical protein
VPATVEGFKPDTFEGWTQFAEGGPFFYMNEEEIAAVDWKTPCSLVVMKERK